MVAIDPGVEDRDPYPAPAQLGPGLPGLGHVEHLVRPAQLVFQLGGAACPAQFGHPAVDQLLEIVNVEMAAVVFGVAQPI